MMQVPPTLELPSVDLPLDWDKQTTWNSHIGRALSEGSSLLAARVNGLLPKDGSEAMTGPLTGTSATFTGQLIGGGTITNDNAAAGRIGEVISSVVLSGAATALVTATAKTVTSIALTAGDWEVLGTVGFVTAATTSVTVFAASLSLVTNTLDTAPGVYQSRSLAALVPGASATLNVLGANASRFSLAAPASVFLVASSTFTVAGMSVYGKIEARRMR